MSMKMEGTALIRRPIDDVVDFMMDANNDPVWDLQRAGGRLRFLSAGRTENSKRDDVFDIYEYAGPERLTRLMRHTRFPHVKITSTWTFMAAADGTRLYVTTEVVPRGILNVITPLIHVDMAKRTTRVLTQLTRALECREHSTVGPGDGGPRYAAGRACRRGSLPSRRSTPSQPLTEGSGTSQVGTGLAPLCVATS